MTTQTIGRYQIKNELGRGGMATVYHAYDPNFERDVAIKVLPAAFLHDPQFRGRFEREAKMIALLEHPAIVPVYDFGDQDGQPYIVMRYMSGGSLADRLNQGAMSFEETFSLVSRLAPALDAAHKRGIIHRDLKPGNILFDQYGNAFLSDFGIARLAESGATTMTGESIIGTPTYMSPEQIQSDKTIDGRSDIYAMGVLIYQMLTGEAPYRADTPAKVMMMHILEPVPDIQHNKKDLPPGSSTVIARAMAKDPDDRYKNTADLAIALQKVTREIESKSGQRPDTDERTLFATPASVPAPIIQTETVTAASSKPISIAQPVSPAREKKFSIPPIAWVIVLLIGGGAIIGGLYIMGRQGNGPLAMLANSPALETEVIEPVQITDTPSESPVSEPSESALVAREPSTTPTSPLPTPTNTPPPPPTLTPTPDLAGPVIGGADKIAFISDSNIWIANLDGSQLDQMTDDGTLKTSLQWSPDGEYLVYITGKCVSRVNIEGGPVQTITCFNRSDSLKSFDISPDGQQVAISLDNQMFIVPFNWDSLSQAATRSDLASLAACQDFGPYQRNFITQVRWSLDSKIIAAKLIGNLGDGRQGDVIQLFNVDQCIPNPRALDNFPAPRFDMRGYNKVPVIPSYSWDGTFLFALTDSVRNDGFGDLYIYNHELHKAELLVNPIENNCCYRDIQWSPDGEYLLFAFQDITDSSNSIQLYYIPYGSVGSGAQYEPIPLPVITNPREKPQPVLRPVK